MNELLSKVLASRFLTAIANANLIMILILPILTGSLFGCSELSETPDIADLFRYIASSITIFACSYRRTLTDASFYQPS
jgi:hypothetical protein